MVPERTARSHLGIGVVLSRTGKLAAALEEYGGRWTSFRKWPTTTVNVFYYQDALARTHNIMGRLQARLKLLDAAVIAIGTGLTIRQKVAAADPKSVYSKNGLGDSLAARGWVRLQTSQPALAAADLRRAIELWARNPDPRIGERFERLGAGSWLGWERTRSPA